jgi:cytohesin
MAARHGREGTVKALLDAGADTEAKDEDERTPLHIAAAGTGNEGIVKALLDAGAKDA